MTMDPFFLGALVLELQQQLVPAAVSKIQQPGAHELVLRFWTGRVNLRLFISVAPHAGRLYLTAASFPNPAAPPRFCQLLRARLRRLLAIDQPVGERRVHLHFAGASGETLLLVVELAGARANLLLLDQAGIIIDSLQRQPEALPGQAYRPPAPLARQSLAAPLPATLPPETAIADWLLRTVTPMTPLLAAEVQAAVTAGVPLESAVAQLQQRWLSGGVAPALAQWQGRPQLLAWLPDYLELATVRNFATLSAAAEAAYAATNAETIFVAGPQELATVLRKAAAKLQRRLQQIAAEELVAAGCERQRELGELLQGGRAQLRRGLEQIEVDDWFAVPPVKVSIPLDPALSAQENVEQYFKRYRKGKRGLQHMARRRAETEAELAWLADIGLALDEADSSDDLAELRAELVAAGLLKVRNEPQRRSRGGSPPRLRQTVTPGGFRLLWGKNNRSNDQVSTRLTAGDDLWFHAHQLAGCHLVLKRDGRSGDIPEDDILHAAALAAGYSRGRHAAKVEVIVAEGRSVKKPNGARPGLVTVTHFRTVLVAPRRLDDLVN